MNDSANCIVYTIFHGSKFCELQVIRDIISTKLLTCVVLLRGQYSNIRVRRLA